VADGDESNENSDGAPEEVNAPDMNVDVVIVVEGAVQSEHGVRIIEEGGKVHLGPVDSWPATLADERGLRGKVGDGVDTDPRDQVVALTEEGLDDLPGCVVGIGDQIEWDGDQERLEELDDLVEEGPLVSIGEDKALMDTSHQGDANDAAESLDNDSYGLTRVAHNPRRLRVGLRGLVELLDGRHLQASLGYLKTVYQEKESTIDSDEPWVRGEHKRDPELSQPCQIQGGAVEEVQDAVVAAGVKAQATDHTGHSE